MANSNEYRKIGVSTFVTSALPHNQCGSNGLPLTPNSIKVLGRAQKLLKFKHKNLCQYIEFRRGKHDRILSVVECYEDNLELLLQKQKSALRDEWNEMVFKVGFEVLQGICYLNEHNITHHNLELSNIMLTEKNEVKLSAYGLFDMTQMGQLVGFPVGKIRYLPPEEIIELNENKPTAVANLKVDTWSLGIILLELTTDQRIFAQISLQSLIKEILSMASNVSSGGVVNHLLAISSIPKTSFKASPALVNVIEKCLTIDVKERPTPCELLNSDLFSTMHEKYPIKVIRQRTTLFTEGCDCSELQITPEDCELPKDHLLSRDLDEIWNLWKLAGGDIMSEVKKGGTVHSIPSILTLPQMMSLNGDVMGLESFWANLYDSTVTIVSLDAVRLRLKDIPPEAYYPLLEGPNNEEKQTESKVQNQLKATSNLPLEIKDKDIEYQLHRMFLYKRLLLGYPYLRDRIWKEARVDIPPHYRGLVWAALLDVKGDIPSLYNDIDKETPIGADRQIAVDIPRCHQYDPLLSSPTAHNKFKRVIKAWLQSHPHLSYWQGLDSLCAAFLHLHFNSEHLAWACMSNFIDKFLHNFFLKDNSAIIQEYLAVFCHLIAFHDPRLANHLNEIGFFPELYSIPWFLTMFTHVFPLKKIAHLWDTLLLGNSSFPLCIGVAILHQLRTQLLNFGFNECILLFSDLPEIDIDDVVQESIKIFCSTPKSATYRVHARKSSSEKMRQVSYYSEDYNLTPQSDLSMTGVPLAELKQQSCPRISADDLIELSELRGPILSKTPTKRTGKTAKPKIIILDVRSEDEFARAAIPGSYNIPFLTALSSDGQLTNQNIVKNIRENKPRVTIIVGNKNSKDDIQFAASMVRLNYKGVCVLHNGIDVLRSTGLLTIQ